MKALVMDDLPENLLIFDRMLLREGFVDNLLISAAETLLGHLKNEPALIESVDIILMDISMPGISGLKISELLKKNPRFKDIPIVIISAQLDEEAKETAGRIGCEFYLKKPVSLSDFRFVKSIAEASHKAKKQKSNMLQQMAEIDTLKAQFQKFVRKAVSSQDVKGLRFENLYSNVVANDWRFCTMDKLDFSGIIFDMDWRNTEASPPADFEYFIQLLLKQAVLLVSARFKKTPIRFLHEGEPEFYIHLPKVSETETAQLAQELRDSIQKFVETRPEYRANLSFCISYRTLVPPKGTKSDTFIYSLRQGLLLAKAQNLSLVKAGAPTGDLKKAA